MFEPFPIPLWRNTNSNYSADVDLPGGLEQAHGLLWQ